MYKDLLFLLEKVKNEKPNDKSSLDRQYAIFITELEKLIAYWVYWIESAKNDFKISD